MLDEADLAFALDFEPFEGDRGPQPRRLRNQIVTAAKSHDCHGCSGGVPKGARHRVLVEVVGDELMSFRWCPACLLEQGRALLGIS